MKKDNIDPAEYRKPLQITEVLAYKSLYFGEVGYYVCPRCRMSLEREFSAFCDRCGQKLSWRGYRKAVIKSAGMLSVCKKTP